MKIGVLGTGIVGETIGTALVNKNHTVMLGSRKAGNEKSAAWKKKAGERASTGTFDDAALYGELIFLCLNGEHTLDAMRSVNTQNLNNKIIIDLTNPLDFSGGMPPKILEEFRDTSLGEKVQEHVPNAYVVKTLNTVNCNVMVDASRINAGDHNLFLCGNDADAKNKVKHFLVDNFNWKPDRLIDLGGIVAARCAEAFVPLWVLVMQAEGTPIFNFKLVK